MKYTIFCLTTFFFTAICFAEKHGGTTGSTTIEFGEMDFVDARVGIGKNAGGGGDGESNPVIRPGGGKRPEAEHNKGTNADALSKNNNDQKDKKDDIPAKPPEGKDYTTAANLNGQQGYLSVLYDSNGNATDARFLKSGEKATDANGNRSGGTPVSANFNGSPLTPELQNQIALNNATGRMGNATVGPPNQRGGPGGGS